MLTGAAMTLSASFARFEAAGEFGEVSARIYRRNMVIVEQTTAAIQAASEQGDLWVNAVTAFGSALLGALAAEFFNRRSRRQETNEKSRLLAYSLFKKLDQMYAATRLFRDSFARSDGRVAAAKVDLAERGDSDRIKIHPSLFFQGFMSTPPSVEFGSEETLMLALTKNLGLMNHLSNLDHQYNGLVGGLSKYQAERERIDAVIQACTKLVRVDGLRYQNEGDESVQLQIELELSHLDKLLGEIRENTLDLHRKAYEGIALLVQSPSMPLGPDFNLRFTDPDGNDVLLMAGGRLQARRWYEFWKSLGRRGPK